MKKKYLILLSAPFYLSVAFSQPAIQWQKSFGGTSSEIVSSVIQTFDKGYAIAGETSSGDGDVTNYHGGIDIWIIKLDSSGILQWQKSIGNANEDIPYSIIQTKDSGYAVAGENRGSVGNHGSADFWVLKLDALGTIQWEKSLGGTSFDVAYSIIQTRDGKFIVAGETNSNDGDVSGLHINSFHSDAWVVMMDSVGNILLQRCLGGTNSENANSVIEVADGDYVIAGNTNSIDGDVSGGGAHGGNDAWIVKLDAGLNIVWQKSLGGSINEDAFSVIQTMDGKYVLAGSTNSTNGDVNGLHVNSSNSDAWIVNLDSVGAIIWQKCLGGSGNDVARSVIQSKDSNFVVAVQCASNNGDVTGNHGLDDFWIVKFNTIGTNKWEKCLGGSKHDVANSLIQANDGGYLIVGSTLDSSDGDVTFNHGLSDEWVVKLFPECNFSLSTITSGLACHGDSTGAISLTVDGDTTGLSYLWSSGETTQNIYGLSSNYYSVAVTDTANCTSVTAVNLTQPTAMALTLHSTNDNGTVNGTVRVNVAGGTAPYTYLWNTIPPQTTFMVTHISAGTYTVTVTDTNGCSDTASITVNLVLGINELTTTDVSFYPNPVSDFFNIKLNDENNRIEKIEIRNLLGEYFNCSSKEEKGITRFDLSGFSQGVYLFQLITRSGASYFGKLLKE